MGRIRRVMQVSALVRARAGFALGCALVVAGVAVNWGLGWGLLVAGVFVAGSFLVLADVDGRDEMCTGRGERG